MRHWVGAGLTLTFGALAYAGLRAREHPPDRYVAVVQIIQREVVERNEAGLAEQVDLELEWDSCPGDQYQVIRGGAQFAACTAQYEVGDYVPVKVVHFWDPQGFYRWDIEQLGACPRTVAPDRPGSFEKSQECSPYRLASREQGFECSRQPFGALLRVCPFMQRQ